MGFLIKKQRGLIFTGIAKLTIIGFIAVMAFAFVDTIWAVYLESFVKNISIVGFISAGLTLVSFCSYFYFIPLIERSNKSKIWFYSMIGFAISYILFAINKNFYFVVVLSFIVTILTTLKITSFGIIIRDKSSERNLSRNEGLMYTFANIAWLIGPLIAGFLAEKYSLSLVFILAAVFISISAFLFKISRINDANIVKKPDVKIWRNFTDFFKNKKRIKAYFLGGGPSFWWSLIFLFIPIYMVKSGLSMKIVGFFLFAIAIPLVSFEYLFSKLAGKTGFKKIFKIGFLIPFFLATLCFFVNNIYIILLLLALASVGLAMLEPTVEAYFFDVLDNKKEECRFYGPYNTTIDVNHFVGRLMAAAILLFLPFKFLFLLFGFFMFLFFLLSFKIDNIIERRRR